MKCQLGACILILLVAGTLNAHAQRPSRTTVRVGGAVGSFDFTCGGCDVDAQSGFAGFVAANMAVGRFLSAGLELAGSDAKVDGRARGDDNARLVGALATAGVRGGSRIPAWGTLGLGWVWYNGIGPNSNGPALSLRVGVDFPIAGPLALSPYAGLLTMLGHDGPRIVTGTDFNDSPTRLRSLEGGLALTLRL